MMLGALALAGCAQSYSPSAGTINAADFGEANRQTYAAMVIDPDPRYEEPMATSGEHAGDAVERYRNDQVKQPATVRTGSGGSN
jgi:type IV pilus biogenesis protein CpaD/CtpE